ncbi:MAG: PucR family transcriptional regulator ligand-binding domain-containing protein [Microcella sp.]|uniref:PucR family transcriptional regulator n=1 Tax=Microcella sp. TaxID=1913979 RepID=UPI0024C5FDBE|nr:PucR family transcriptional regulator [Microcella sp.]UYN84008.1 MAG: PucR family transcriptional regulator ligand-binding domain-containing protein [Microcella sp.]
MALTLAELLALPALAAADPRLVSGDPKRDVRWVHTSEIFDIATLLKGGEALLTSGLGLVAASDARMRAYAQSLIEIDVGALLFEVGRTFSEIPAVIADELRGSRVALVRLDGVVPFIDITESAHRLILDAESLTLRASDQATRRLMDVLVKGGGVSAVLSTLAELTGAPAAFIDAEGREVAASGTVPPNARELERPVEVFGERRGVIRSAAAVTADHRVVIDRGAAAIALELARSGSSMPTRRYAHEQLLHALLHDDLSADELDARARALGVVADQQSRLIAVLCAPAPGRSLDDAYVHLVDTVPRVLGPAVIGRVGQSVAMITSVAASSDPTGLRSTLGAVTAGATQLFRSVTAGGAVADWGGVATSLREAVDGATIAPLLGATGALLAEDTALLRLLRTVDDAGSLDDFITRQLGPVLEADARRGSELLRTLAELFRAGGSRSAAARALAIRRQTLYNRLERVERLLGAGALSDPTRAVTVHVAILAWALATRTPGHSLASSSR